MLKDSFLKYLLLERNYSEKTILSYGIDLDEFEAYFKGVDVELEFTSVDADVVRGWVLSLMDEGRACLLYTSPSPRDKRQSRMPSSA